MYSIDSASTFQPASSNEGFIYLQSYLPGFTQHDLVTHSNHFHGHELNECIGSLPSLSDEERICPTCGKKMHIKSSHTRTLRHIPFGSTYTRITVETHRLYCEHCSHSLMQPIPFKAEHHSITRNLETYIEDLLASGRFTLKMIAEMAGVGAHLVKDVDKARLSRLHIEQTPEGPSLRKPDTYSQFLAIDEFKLHDGHKYATHIIDLETGHILWIAKGKKKQVVYDFIDHVGSEWMSHVKAVACDMNSDFQEAFEERCENISIVFDYFHIVKNFNDKVISEVRKDVQKELIAEGKIEQAKQLKGSKYILMSSLATLEHKDAKGEAGTVLGAENTLFGMKPVLAKTGYVKRYKELLKLNALFTTCDIVKTQLEQVFKCRNESEMTELLNNLIDTCRGTKNKHFEWFARLIENHYQGIFSHAVYGISSGKIEGINNKIKTIRRQAYGYNDDGYFFLKIIDASRN